MLFSSTVFILLFLPITVAIYYLFLAKTKKAKNVFLLVMSIIFYAWGEPTFVLIMLLSILANWIFGLLIDKYSSDKIKTRITLIVMLIFNLGILGGFKYANFFMQNINLLFNANIPNLDVKLPIGISFFTFQAISYVLDVYNKDTKVQKNILNMGLYISFFPQLIAGPIVRYKTIAQQIENRKENFNNFSTRNG